MGKSVYSSDTCISCLEPKEEDENEDANDDAAEEEAAETAEVCRNLYEAAGKCEGSHGFEASVWDANDDAAAAEYENQEEQESLICDYIYSLKAGTYVLCSRNSGPLLVCSYASFKTSER